MPQTVLICEDDVTLSGTLQTLLQAQGYRTLAVRHGRHALDCLRQEQPALLILDLMLPDMDGFDVCRRLRAHHQIPVIMISGRSGEMDRLVGLEVGADDYLSKPFGPNELVARVQAHLRRATEYSRHEVGLGYKDLGDLRLDRDAHQVLLCGQVLHLTPKEYELLSALAENRGTVVRSSHLLMRVWGYDASIRTRTLDVHIGRLRAKLEDDARQPRYIITVPGVGYKLCAPDGAARAA